ncbi:tudor domain-containing protein 5 [Spea bombifrons]|uniref:tudor domain-containing protein 5 n=1 Tax=Spea bombifrons TaxID=233779 RepID=UPI00234ADCCC|nr:tudor domain-containing protein 5 [Spea bombifrons]
MDEERILQRVQKEVRSLLIASKKGLSVQELEQDYRMMIGSNLPLRTLGYRSSMELLLDMPNVVQIHSQVDGTVILTAVVDEATKRIAELVSRQRDPAKSKGRRVRQVRPRCHVDLVRRGRVAPVLPAAVKSDLRDLLSISPLLISELEKAFVSRFGRSFQYTRYGFYSMLEVIRSIADIVEVKQTRAGSLLALRRSNASGKVNGQPMSQDLNRKPVVDSSSPTVLQPHRKDLCQETPNKQTQPINTSNGSFVQHPELKQNLCAYPVEVPNVLQEDRSPVVPKVSAEDRSSAATKALEERSLAVPNVSAEDRSSAVTKALEEDRSPAVPRVTKEDESRGNCVHSPYRPTKTTITNSSLGKPKPVIETFTPEIQRSAMHSDQAPLSEFVKEESLHFLEEKLEKELRLCLVQKGTGGMLSPELRREIKHVVNQHPKGLLVSQLPSQFKSYIGKDLQYRKLGFTSVMELIGSLGDMLHLESTPNEDDWHIFDTEALPKLEDSKVFGPAADPLSSWNSPQQQPVHVKPVGFKVSQADGNLWWGPQEIHLSSSTEKEIPPDAVIHQKLHCLPRMKRGFMVGVFVENITSPSEFYIRCCGKDMSEKLEDMMIEMRRCYSNECVSERYLVPDHCVAVGGIYAARVDGDVWWYRVILHAFVGTEDVDVFYPDFGHVTTVKRSWLRFLKNCYMKLPAQAVPSCLAFVSPLEDAWSVQATKRFQQQCDRGPLVGLVLQYVVDVLYLFLCDTSSDEDVYLHQLLTTQGLAQVGQDPIYYKTSQKCNPFVHYLAQPQGQLSEEPLESPEQNEGLPSGFPNHSESVVEVKEETVCGIPYIEAFPKGTDIWDETWSVFGSEVGSRSSSLDVNECEKKSSPELQSSPPSEELDDASMLHSSLGDFYISLIESKKSEETNDSGPLTPTRDFSGQETINPLDIGQNSDDHLSSTSEENFSGKNHDLSIDSKPTYYHQTGLRSPMGLQKFQIPRSAKMRALGAAARLATDGGFLNWPE